LLNLLYEVDGVLSSEAALEKIANNDYDLIVTDIKMPRLNGEQLYEQMAGLDPRLAQRIIFMTGDVISASTQQFLQDTKNRYITKPFQLEESEKLFEESVATIEEVGDLATPLPRTLT
jgi:two-component system NtrC family sensor kinase